MVVVPFQNSLNIEKFFRLHLCNTCFTESIVCINTEAACSCKFIFSQTPAIGILTVGCIFNCIVAGQTKRLNYSVVQRKLKVKSIMY